MALKQAVPLLRVTDVARSMGWYCGTLGFVGDPFPASPPYEFAILRHGQVELMLRRGSPPVRQPRQYDWDVYLRRDGDRFREMFAAFNARGIVWHGSVAVLEPPALGCQGLDANDLSSTDGSTKGRTKMRRRTPSRPAIGIPPTIPITPILGILHR
jgi:hypothetical protein